MKVKVASRGQHHREFQIEDEDITMGNVLHHELLKDRHVVSAGARAPHPLLKRLIVEVYTDGADPKDTVDSICKEALQTSQDILEAIKRALGGGEQG